MRLSSPKIIVMIVWLLAIASHKALARDRFDVYFTKEDAQGALMDTPIQRFDCGDKIHAILETRGLSKATHGLDVYWINPRGQRQEHTELDFRVTGDRQDVWVWIKLHRPKQAIVDRVFLQNRATGMEDFIGQWKAQFFVDGKRAATRGAGDASVTLGTGPGSANP